jgi:hypothetical protein
MMHAAAGMRSDRAWQMGTMIHHDVPRRFVPCSQWMFWNDLRRLHWHHVMQTLQKETAGFGAVPPVGQSSNLSPAILGNFFLARVNSPISLVLLFQVRGCRYHVGRMAFCVHRRGRLLCPAWDLNDARWQTRSRPGWGSLK